jgi:hypothetical protein
MSSKMALTRDVIVNRGDVLASTPNCPVKNVESGTKKLSGNVFGVFREEISLYAAAW